MVTQPKSAKEAGQETRARMLRAAMETVREEGYAAASARTIARRGGFNQALIFYHFGSVDRLLAAAARSISAERAALYAREFAEVTTLPELVEVARRVNVLESREDSVATLTQLLAGAAYSDELRQAVLEGFEPWMGQVRQTIERVLEDSPYTELVSTDDLTFAISSMFVGMSLMSALEPTRDRTDELLASVTGLSNVVEALLRLPLPGAARAAKRVARRTPRH